MFLSAEILHDLFFGISFFALGLIFGSFANVVIYRWPLGQSVVSPGSACPSCKTPVKWYDNIPILSYLLLKGRCRVCQVKISLRYPFVEFITGFLFLSIYLKFGLSITSLEYMIFTVGAVSCFFIDLDHYLLPDLFTLSGIVLGLLGSLINPERDFLSAMVGFILGGGFLWSIAYLYLLLRKQEGMGGGDIKLMAWLGALLGWPAVPFIILVSSLVGSIAGLFVSFRNPDGLKAVIPFGPYIIFGAYLYIFFGKEISLWYLSLFFPV